MADINLTLAVAVFVLLAIATLGLALYRKFISAGEQDLVHLGAGEDRQIPGQVVLAGKLKAIDRWGKILTVITAMAGVVMVALYLYKAFLIHN